MPTKKKPGPKAKPGPKPTKHRWRKFYYAKVPRKNGPIVENGRKSLLIRHGAEDTEVIKRIGFNRFRFMRWGGDLRRRTKQVRGEVIALLQTKGELLKKKGFSFLVPRALYGELEIWHINSQGGEHLKKKMNYYTYVWLLDRVEQIEWDQQSKTKP